MATSHPSPFLGLPAELRIRIYEYALQYQGVLQRPLRASAWRDFAGYVANVSLLRTCKLVHKEAVDIFFDLNTFRISYYHLCTCQNRYPYKPFNAERIRRVEVSNFLPKLDLPDICEYCRDGGVGLFKTMKALPRLRSLHVAFEDMFSFTDFAPPILHGLYDDYQISSTCDEVGKLDIHGFGLKTVVELPVLHRAWGSLSESRKQPLSLLRRCRGAVPMRKALEYLQFEANTYERTPGELRPFFIPRKENDNTHVLRFKGLPNESTQRSNFTIAVASVLSEIFSDDGGSRTIDWVDLDHFMFAERWYFDEGIADKKEAAEMGK
jgi:hypothetical protein